MDPSHLIKSDRVRVVSVEAEVGLVVVVVVAALGRSLSRCAVVIVCVVRERAERVLHAAERVVRVGAGARLALVAVVLLVAQLGAAVVVPHCVASTHQRKRSTVCVWPLAVSSRMVCAKPLMYTMWSWPPLSRLPPRSRPVDRLGRHRSRGRGPRGRLLPGPGLQHAGGVRHQDQHAVLIRPHCSLRHEMFKKKQ